MINQLKKELKKNISILIKMENLFITEEILDLEPIYSIQKLRNNL